ncbi:hypothetical protein GCM10022220_00190 [Actinocatenispora rupis]|uniref:Uncharacterized protein n=1 Tax=Actinocatenispora rupis TaxID=519421 RepID=A0A8J3NFR2_9ACTN|nr:hypothetical protein Aru02nite_49730 [Actinocatenispora rupis]
MLAGDDLTVQRLTRELNAASDRRQAVERDPVKREAAKRDERAAAARLARAVRNTR